MPRPNIFFTPLDLSQGFTARASNSAIHEKILIDSLDMKARTGGRTRLLRLDPGCTTPDEHAHPYWEELYVLEGAMEIHDGTDGWKTVIAPAFAARKPGVMHGPLRTTEGCLLLEFSWYD